MRVSTVTVSGLAALALLDTSFVAPASAQGAFDYWNGWYGGANAGYRWGDANFTSAPYSFTPPPPWAAGPVSIPGRNESFNLDSGVVGVHLGVNRVQDSSNWMIGLEGSFDWGWGDDGSAGAFSFFNPDTSCFQACTIEYARVSELEMEWQGSIRGRLGRLSDSGSWLTYLTAGVAFVHLEWRESVNGFAIAQTHKADSTEFGGIVGVGAERISDNRKWIAGAELLYEWFGDFNVPHGFTNPPQTGKIDDIDAFKLRVRLSRKFNSN